MPPSTRIGSCKAAIASDVPTRAVNSIRFISLCSLFSFPQTQAGRPRQWLEGSASGAFRSGGAQISQANARMYCAKGLERQLQSHLLAASRLSRSNLTVQRIPHRGVRVGEISVIERV